MATPETLVKNKIMKYLKENNIYHFRKNQVAGDKVGIPDIIAIRKDGIFVGIEVKAEKGIQSKAQKVHQNAIEKSNGIYLLAKSENELEGIFEALKEEN